MSPFLASLGALRRDAMLFDDGAAGHRHGGKSLECVSMTVERTSKSVSVSIVARTRQYVVAAP
jgi:hypothetical protein